MNNNVRDATYWSGVIVSLVFFVHALYFTITVSILYLPHAIALFYIFGSLSGLFYNLYKKFAKQNNEVKENE